MEREAENREESVFWPAVGVSQNWTLENSCKLLISTLPFHSWLSPLITGDSYLLHYWKLSFAFLVGY